MLRDVGTADRIARLLLGGVLVVVGSGALAGLLVDLPTLAAAALTFVGAVLFVTGLVGTCPLYRVESVRRVHEALFDSGAS